MTRANVTLSSAQAAFSASGKYGYAYVLVLSLLACQAIWTVCQSSIALRDNQRIAELQQQKTALLTAQSNYNHQVALNLAIKPIQQELAPQFQPISTFLTASTHVTVASR
jgi:predicted nuclease of restriction endonuclease-like RecB superfamily